MAQIAPRSIVHDVVIIGSGAGGGTVTKVLADLGVKVLLMEAGPMVSMGDFKMLHGPYSVWHRGAGEHAEAYTGGMPTPLSFNAFYRADQDDEPYTVAEGDVRLGAVLVEADERTGKATRIEPLFLPVPAHALAEAAGE